MIKTKISNLLNHIKYLIKICFQRRLTVREYLEIAKKSFPVKIKIYDEESKRKNWFCSKTFRKQINQKEKITM